METTTWLPVILLGLVTIYGLYRQFNPFNNRKNEERPIIKDSVRKPKKRKKYKSRSKATKVEAPHKRKPGRPKKENKI